MKHFLFFFLLLSFASIQSCDICPKVALPEFHYPFDIYLENEAGKSIIGPLGSFDIFSAGLYNEEGKLVDTMFSVLTINDWNKDWFEDDVKYSRKYNLQLKRTGTEVFEIYNIGFNYWGNFTDCDLYQIKRLQVLINDSLYVDSGFTFHSTIMLPN